MRVGIGYDIHRLVSRRRLMIGGVEIPYIKGLEGHSDGDVLLHAICDAILGAIGEGDIGEHFPDDQALYKDISSEKLLKKVLLIATARNFQIENIDSVVVAEQPRLSPFKEKIKIRISQVLGLTKNRVNVKASTNEGLGSIGREEAVASYAVVSLQEKKKR